MARVSSWPMRTIRMSLEILAVISTLTKTRSGPGMPRSTGTVSSGIPYYEIPSEFYGIFLWNSDGIKIRNSVNLTEFRISAKFCHAEFRNLFFVRSEFRRDFFDGKMDALGTLYNPACFCVQEIPLRLENSDDFKRFIHFYS